MFDQNAEGIFKVDQNVESDKIEVDQNVKKNVKSQKLSKNTFDVLKFFDAIGNIRTLKVFGQLPMAYYLCVPRPVGG